MTKCAETWRAGAGMAYGPHSPEMAIVTFCRLPIKTHCCLAPPWAPTNLSVGAVPSQQMGRGVGSSHSSPILEVHKAEVVRV